MIISIFFITTLLSCEKKIDWPVDEENERQVVVFGMITSEYKTQEVKISYSLSGPNEEPEPLTGAQVIVSTTDTVYTFSEDSTRPGYYYSQIKFSGKQGNEYTLFINANGTIISGKATMEKVTDFDILETGMDDDKINLKIMWVAEPYNLGESAMYEIFLDWSQVPAYQGLPIDSTTARLWYYTLPAIDVSQLFSPVMEKISFPVGTIITEKKYSLTKDHAAYIRAMLAETNLQGGLFNSVPANVPITLSNNTLGYFSACEVLTKTTIAGQ